VVWINSI
jgi:hypothetical protein